jgi:hypothetical protein
MANTIRIKRRLSSTVGAPSTLASAELAFNETSAGRILYYGLGDVSGTASSVIAIAGPDFVANSIPNLTGVVTSVGTTTSIANSTITNAMLVNSAVANLSGTNTGDNAVNTLYSGLVSNATHTGDATGSTALTVVKINGVLMSGLATGLLKNTTSTGAPSIAVAGTDYVAPGGALGTPSSGTLTNCTFPTLNQNTTGTAAGLSATLAVSSGGTGVTTSTGTGAGVHANSPTLITPDIGAATGTSLVLSGNLTVNGTTTTISSTTLAVGDKNIVLASASTTEAGADGGGLTLKGLTDHTWNWVQTTAAWTASEHIDLASGKSYYINGTVVLSATSLGSGIILDGGTF